MKLIYGVAFNSKGVHRATHASRRTTAYLVWCNILRRCYDSTFKRTHPTYRDCTVCEEWLDFQNFAEWYTNHDYYGLGYDVDKDLLIQGNKLYSPETCSLVPQELNKLLTDRKAARGKYPQGVTLDKHSGRFMVRISIDGRNKNIGRFSSPEVAHKVYREAKESYVKVKAKHWRDHIAPEVFDALMAWTLPQE